MVQALDFDPDDLPETSADTLDEVNVHTQGTEFYGPSGVFSFLARLRSKASSHGPKVNDTILPTLPQGNQLHNLSVVNFLHSLDYPASSATESDVYTAMPASTPRHEIPTATARDDRNTGDAMPNFWSDLDVEKECLVLYFRNLHLIHPILQQSEFTAKCERMIWGKDHPERSVLPYDQRVFRALYNAVLALGSITAGEDALFMQGFGNRNHSPLSVHPPLQLARVYFERAKASLGDIFETCSIESTQTLFLLSVFCQNALKPHSCYMYSGMALRTALATGITHSFDRASEQLQSLWWALYSHEVEMCASAGRESGLSEPSSYRVKLPPRNKRSPSALITCMVYLAEILKQASKDVYDSHATAHLAGKSARALDLDRRLVEWRTQLPGHLDFQSASLTDPEWAIKQKTVLELREYA